MCRQRRESLHASQEPPMGWERPEGGDKRMPQLYSQQHAFFLCVYSNTHNQPTTNTKGKGGGAGGGKTCHYSFRIEATAGAIRV